MSAITTLREVFRVFREFIGVVPILLGAKMHDDGDRASLGAMFEDAVAKYPNNTLLLFEERQWTYSEFNAHVNQLAHLLQKRGFKRGECAAVVMENRPEFPLVLLALAKLGVAASLINNSLKGDGLVHCIKETNATYCIVGEECGDVIADVMSRTALNDVGDYFWVSDSVAVQCPDWAEDIKLAMNEMPISDLAVTKEITAGEVALYIFTSGTTGLPKAVPNHHRKMVFMGKLAGRLGFRVKPTDRLYLCLPMYHITGLGPGFCGFIANGASVYLRRSFSASTFWQEVKHSQTNCFIYVGELCRYLATQPECDEEKDNPLEKMMGNGLRPDVWDQFKRRFGVKRITEMYGASESNISFMNIFNKDRTIGAALTPVAVVQYDTENEEVVRDANGHCIELPIGDSGLLLGKITPKTNFDGYTNPEATASKIVSDVLEDGDRWFNSGDLVRQIEVGFAMGLKHFQFVDRTGDTFRWRAENVSTNEVAEVLNIHPQINMANVYGVEIPGIEGRAGMVAFASDEEFDLDAFQALVERELPPYAQPVFVRIQRDIKTTATFKLVKTDMREQAYHPDKVNGDTIYVRKPRSSVYEPLDVDFYTLIMAEKSGF